jgi:transcriptional regulator with XRE-family HTH domain
MTQKRLTYDEDALVEALGRGEETHAEIGRRLGLARATVEAISRGVRRADLQPRIRYLRRGRRPPRTRKKKNYDDEVLVMAIARGDKTYGQIAGQVGLSRKTVSRIACGTHRPDLQPRIQAATRAFLDQTQRLAAAWATQVMAKHVKEGLEGRGETARRCREYVLSQCLGDPGRTEVLVNQLQNQEHQSPGGGVPGVRREDLDEFYRWVADKNGYTED